MFQFFVPTNIIFGHGCIGEQYELFKRYGKRALVVTGRHSAVRNGSLQAVGDACSRAGVEIVIFNEVESNPEIGCCRKGAALAAAEKVDFIIGIGGGSPLDAAKAIALIAANPELDDEAIFRGPYKPVLPIVAVPTTSGTGSEVTPYSILTLPEKQQKLSLAAPEIFPVCALLDPAFTEGIGIETTIDTAVDALSHLMEGFVSMKGNPVSDALALEGLAVLEAILPRLRDGVSEADREDLMYASLLGGMVIAHTATTLLHGMGYPLTFFHHVPHGRANGILLAPYFRALAEENPAKINLLLEALNLADLDELDGLMAYLFPDRVEITEEECQAYAADVITRKNIAITPMAVSEATIRKLFETLVKG